MIVLCDTASQLPKEVNSSGKPPSHFTYMGLPRQLPVNDESKLLDSWCLVFRAYLYKMYVLKSNTGSFGQKAYVEGNAINQFTRYHINNPTVVLCCINTFFIRSI